MSKSGAAKSKRRKQPKPVTQPEVTKAAGGAMVWWPHAAVVLGLLLANLWLYHPAFGLGFLSVDDGDYVQNNPYIDSFSPANLKRIFSLPYSANYAPANLLSYALDVALAGGKSALGFHLSSVLWHGWVVCMVYWLAFVISADVPAAAAAGFLFMLHPAHVEVVAWISSRKDLIATGFAVLSMGCYLLSRRRLKDRGGWYAASLLAFLAGSAAKQSVLLLPAVLLAWDLWVENRRNWQMVLDKVPYGIISLFFGWMTWHAQPATGQILRPFVLAGTELANLWLLTGFGQYVLYRPAPDPAGWSEAARCLVISAGVLVWAVPLVVQKARQPVLATMCWWVIVQMVPPMVLGFIVPITDRYLFLPSVGVCILLASLAARIPGNARWIGWAVLAGLGAVWGVKAIDYLAEWSDPRSVWYGAHFKTKDAQVCQFLGEVYQNAGERLDNFVKSSGRLDATNDLKLAQAMLDDAAAVERLRAEWLHGAPSRTNTIAFRDQLWRLAWEQFEAAVARRGMLSTPNLFMCRGRLLVREGKSARAIAEFQNALRLAEVSHYQTTRFEGVTHALYAIGVAYWNLGNYREAQQWLLQAQAVQRKSGQVWIGTLDENVEQIKGLAAGQR